MTAPLPPGVPDLTWKLAQEDTFWTRFLPTFLAISYSLWIRKIAKVYRTAIRDAVSRTRGE